MVGVNVLCPEEDYKNVFRRFTRGSSPYFELHGGGSWRAQSATENAGRGWTGDLILIDEARLFGDDLTRGLMPILTQSKRGQMWMFSNASPARSGPFYRAKRAHEAGSDPGLRWFEWALERGEDWNFENWKRVNPGVPEGKWAAIDAQRAYMPEDAFRNEYGNEWPDESENPLPFEAELWEACRGRPEVSYKRSVGGMDVDAAGRIVYFQASVGEDGKVHVRMDGDPPYNQRMLLSRDAGWLLPDYPNARQASQEQWARASMRISDLVRQGELVHIGDPQMTKEALETEWRSGDRRVFTSSAGARITAATLAVWLLHEQPVVKAFCIY